MGKKGWHMPWYGEIAQKLLGDDKARSLHLSMVRAGLLSRQSLEPSTASPGAKINSGWGAKSLHASERARLQGRLEDALGILRTSVLLGDLDRPAVLEHANALFRIAYEMGDFEYCDLASRIAGKSRLDMLKASENYQCLRFPGPDQMRDEALSAFGHLLAKSDRHNAITKVVLHNFVLSRLKSEGSFFGISDPLWLINSSRAKPDYPKLFLDQSMGISLHALRIEDIDVDDEQGDQADLVSVIVPLYNAASTMEYSLYALRKQTYKNLEIIIVNDASTDDSLAIALSHAQKDQRIKVISNPVNLGIYKTRNVGLSEATGEYVTVCDPDDFPLPELIEEQLHDLTLDSKLVAIMSKGITLSEELMVGDYGRPNSSSLLFKRERVLDALGFWDQGALVSSDSELYERMLKRFSPSVLKTYNFSPLSLVLSGGRVSATRRGEFDIRRTLYTAGGYRSVYRGRYRKWHSESDSLKVDVGSGIGLMGDYITTRELDNFKSGVSFVADLANVGDSMFAEIKSAAQANPGMCFVAPTICLFANPGSVDPRILELLGSGLVRFATYEAAMGMKDTIFAPCNSLRHSADYLEEFCRCSSQSKVV